MAIAKPALARAQGQARLARAASRRSLQPEGAARGRRHPADAPRQARPRSSRELARWGASPAAGITGAAITHPDDVGADRRARRAHLRRAPPALERARPRAAPSAESAPATASRSCAATTAASSRRRSRSAKLGASALYLNTMFAGPQLVEVMRARGPRGAGLRRGVRRPARRGRRRTAQRFVSWTRRRLAPADETTDALIAVDRRRRPQARPTSRAASSSSPRARPGRRRAPSAPRPTRSARWRRCSRRDPAARRRDDR